MENLESDVEKLLEKLEAVRKEGDKTKTEIANLIGVRRETYYRWVNEKEKPSEESCKKISKFLESLPSDVTINLPKEGVKVEANAGMKVKADVQKKSIKKALEDVSETDEVAITRSVKITLSRSTWEKLSKVEDETEGDVIRKALKEFIEREGE